MGIPKNAIHVVQGEMSMVVSCMRRSARSSAEEDQDPLLQGFATLKLALSGVSDLSLVPVEEFVAPFLAVIRSQLTTGPITGMALSSIHKFLSYGLIDPLLPHAARGIENIADAVTHAKFIGTDLASDEVVLMKILQVLRTLLLSPISSSITNESVCELMQSCFRICFEMRLSELLRRLAEQTLTDMIHRLFSRLGDLKDSAAAPGTAAAESPMKRHLRRTSLDGRHNFAVTSGSNASSANPSAPATHSAPTPSVSSSSLDPAASVPSSETPSEDEEAEDAAGTAPAEPSSAAPGDTKPPVGRKNSRGVRFAKKETTESSTLVPYGVPCIGELLRFLVSLINPRDRQNTDNMITMGLSLLTVAMETGGHHLSRFPSLLDLIRDSLCKNLFMLLRTENMTIYAATLRVIFLTFESLRTRLKFQLSHFLVLLMEMNYMSYEHREGALDCILNLCRIPSFLVDLYINFDCNLYCNPIFERLVKFLSQNAFPEDQGLFSTHLIALDALMAFVREIESRSDAVVAASPRRRNTAQPEGKLPSPGELATLKERKKLLIEGMELFNDKPKKGLAFLQEKGLLSTPFQAKEVAQFLRADPLLDKAKIGEYIGAPTNKDILMAFVQTFDFSDKTLDEALRAFLASFRLPGEAQIIERIVECFSEHWHVSFAGERAVKNKDAAFILSYAIILLNVDQHNPKNKKPMQFKDFVRNQRGLNEGADFPEEYLLMIYNNIRTREIVMPEEQAGELKEDYEWKVMLERSGESMVLCGNTSDYDQDVFLQIWGPTVAALSYVFDTTKDETIINAAVEGFHTCAAICARFNLCDVFDNIVVALCKRASLGRLANSEQSKPPEESLAYVFGYNTMVQLATKTVFSLAREHGDILREGWKDLLQTIRLFLQVGLLPDAMLDVEDFVSPTGRTSLLPAPKVAASKSDGSIFSALSYFLSSEPPAQEEKRPDDVAALKRGKACISECNLPTLFSESKMLQRESLLDLVKTLIFMAQGPAAHAAMGTVYHEQTALFFLELLTDVTLWNKDRIGLLWPSVSAHLRAHIAGVEQNSLLTERAVVSLLRLSSRLFHKEELVADVLGLLVALQSLHPDVERDLRQQLVAGVGRLAKANAATLDQHYGWEVVLSILGKAQGDEACMADALGTIVHIITEARSLSPSNFAAIQGLVITFAQVSKQPFVVPPPPEPLTRGRGSKATNVPAAPTAPGGGSVPAAPVSVRVLDLLQALHTQVLAQLAGVQGRGLWTDHWEPLLQAMANLCTDARRPVRQAALTALQRSLLIADLEHMKPPEWHACLERVLFPLLARLLEPLCKSALSAGELEETRMRSCALLCKVFLQHLNALLPLEDFASLWLNVIEFLKLYMFADNSEMLQEFVRESLKNNLLVMSTAGVLRAPGTPDTGAGVHLNRSPTHDPAVLWQLTWARINEFVPNLHEELFPSTPLPSPSLSSPLPQTVPAFPLDAGVVVTTPPVASSSAAVQAPISPTVQAAPAQVPSPVSAPVPQQQQQQQQRPAMAPPALFAPFQDETFTIVSSVSDTSFPPLAQQPTSSGGKGGNPRVPNTIIM